MADRQKNVVPLKGRWKSSTTSTNSPTAVKVTFQEKAADQLSQKAIIQIPRTAVVDKNGKSIVLVFEGEQPREREVQLGTFEGEYVTIEKGLVDGEKIVVEGTQYLTHN